MSPPHRLLPLALFLSLSLALAPASSAQRRAGFQERSAAAKGTTASPKAGVAQIAAEGTKVTDWWVKEADVAAGGGRVLTAFMHGAPPTANTVLHDQIEIRYAFFDGRGWREGAVDETKAVAADPAVVYDAWNDRFVITYFRTDGLRVQQDTEKPIYARIFDPETGQFVRNAPTLVLPNGQGDGFYDKPWIVAGRRSASCQELVVTAFFKPGGFSTGGVPDLSYARSLDGGLSWTVGEPVDQNGARMKSLFTPQPAIPDANPGAPLYLVTRKATRWTFWENQLSDPSLRAQAGDPCEPTPFAPVFTPLGLVHNPVANNEFINSKVPGTGKMVRVPYLVADPTSRDRLYMVFTDVRPGAGPNSGDMDVLCLRLERDPATGTWSKSAPVRVNDNPTNDQTDQFTPAAVVDERGRLHVFFFDGRRYAGGGVAVGCNGPGAKYDATYAISADGGATFQNFPIETLTGEPVICEDLPAAKQPPGEYPGIAVDGDRVWVAFAGTSHEDATADQTVIWAAEVEAP